VTPFRWPVRIQFVDTDASGRIHYTALLRHFEAAEVEFFRHIGLPYNHIEDREVSLPRVHVEADYLAALTFDDEVEVEVSVERVGEKSYTLAFRVLLDETLAAKGKLVIASMDRATQRSRLLPVPLRSLLLRIIDEQGGKSSEPLKQ